MYYPCSENKGADQLRGYREADLRLCFRIGQIPVFSRWGSNDLTVIFKIPKFEYMYLNCITIQFFFFCLLTSAFSYDQSVSTKWHYLTCPKCQDSYSINRAASRENQIFANAKTKVQISCVVTAQLISTFVFATWIEQSLLMLNPKFQASSLFLRL